METQYLSCCGVKELAEIQYDKDAKETLRQLYQGDNLDGVDYKMGRFFIFTQANSPRRKKPAQYGTNLAAFIEENKLGSVVDAGTGINPNSRNNVTVWVWKIDTKAFERWAKKQKFEDPADTYQPYYNDDGY